LSRVVSNANPKPIGNFMIDPRDSAMVMHIATNRPVAIDKPQMPPIAKPEPAVSTDAPPRPVVVPVQVVSSPPTPMPRPEPAIQRKAQVPPPPEPRAEEKPAAVFVQVQAPVEIPTPADGDIGIAIFWQGTADIDLRVAARAGLPEAYWHRPEAE